MATASAQDGAKKKRKAQRPLVVPALPLKLKPKQQPVTELTPAPPIANDTLSAPEPETNTEEAVTIGRPTQESWKEVNGSSSPLLQGGDNWPAVTVDDGRAETNESPAVPEVPDDTPKAVNDEEDGGSRSTTPKASSRAHLSSTQSPASELASAESHANGIGPRDDQSAPVAHTGTHQSHDSEAVAPSSGHSAQDFNTIMPPKYFSSQEPILDWADEMSEEMPPDTLHIPSVPHLPELSSDSSAVHYSSIPLSVPNHTSQQYPARPAFGASTGQEQQSDEIDAMPPVSDRAPLTNGYACTTESKKVISDSMVTTYEVNDRAVPHAKGHNQFPSQVTSDLTVVSDISSHLSKLFETRQWADWTIEVAASDGSYPPVAYHAHSVVISRSSLLRNQMQKTNFASPITRLITLSPPRYVQPSAFEAALKFLYNNQVLTPTECNRYFPFAGSDSAGAIKSYRLDFCFSYWLGGLYLGLPSVSEAGCDLLKEFVDWDTVEILIGAYLDVKKGITSQQLSSTDGPADTPPTSGTTTSPLSGRRRDPYAGPYMDSLNSIDIFIESLSSGKLGLDLQTFRLDTKPSQILRSYLPDLQQYNNHSNPALASITFGSLPTTTLPDSKPQRAVSQPMLFSSSSSDSNVTFSPAEQALSAILLNLPFEELNQLFKGLMQAFSEFDVLKLIAEVIKEREQRRMRVVGSNYYQSEVAANRRLCQVDYMEELLSNGGESRLNRRINDTGR